MEKQKMIAITGLVILLAGLTVSLLYSPHWIAEGSTEVTTAVPRKGFLNKVSDPSQEQSTTIYRCIVPKSAIWSDGRYEYVFRIERVGDVWGTAYATRKMVVEVIETDDSDAALSSQLPAGVIIATEWDQPYEDGTRVTIKTTD